MFFVRLRSICFIPLLLFCTTVLSPSILLGQSNDKLDPILKRLLLPTLFNQATTNLLVKQIGADSVTDVFIRTADGTVAFTTPGIKIKSVTHNLVVASIPLSRLSDVAAEGHVLSMHAAKVWQPLLDESVSSTTINAAQTAYGVTGRGVIVGVIDTGIDWEHMDFRKPEDPTRTRIKYYWDLSETSGPPPSGIFAASGGTEFTEEIINQALEGTVAITTGDPVGHGTHVAGIAAGNGGGTGFVGMAPEADLIVVNASRIDGQGFLSTDIIVALNYIDDKAEEMGKPYVVNMSFGGQQGPHDGRSAEAEAINTIFGTGKTGKVGVAAAGNDGVKGIHTSGQLISSVQAENRSFQASAGQTIGIDLWTQISPNNPNQVFVSVAGPDTTFGPVSGFPPVTADHTDGTISIGSSPFPVVVTGTDINTDIQITVKKSGTWTIGVQGEKGSGSGRFDMWVYTGNAQFDDADTLMHVGTPGAAHNAITVGAHVTKNSWTDATGMPRSVGGTIEAAASFSSPGPTRDGRMKPEITAPGQIIGSSLSGDATPGNGFSIFNNTLVLAGNTHAMAQGTSMATPHVTGAVALVLQEAARRTVSLDAIQIRDALINTALADIHTGMVPNNKWGYGKMVVDSLLARLFGDPLPRITTQTVQTDTGTVAFTAPDNSQTTVKFQSGTVAGNMMTYEHFGPSAPSSVQSPLSAGPLQFFSLSTTLDDTVSFSADITLNYTDAMLANANTPPESSLYLFRYDEIDSSWHQATTVVDTNANTAMTTTTEFSIWALASALPTGIEENHQTSDLPVSYILDQNYPNPFNPSTTIRYALQKAGPVRLIIYNIAGQRVRTLIDTVQPAGQYTTVWNGQNDHSRPVSSGVYLYQLSTDEFSESRRMLLLK